MRSRLPKRPALLSDLDLLLNPWVVAIAFFSAVGWLVITLGFLWFTRTTTVSPASFARFEVTPAPTATLTQTVPAPTPRTTPTSSMPPAPLPGLISTGTYVQIRGTGGDGLRLRSEPGLKGPVLLVGTEAEVFQVSDGPRQVDGYTWWLLTGPYAPSRTGWAVANYLAVVQNP